jgi:hypothetical protein
MTPEPGELVPWSGFGMGRCCCVSGCIEGEDDPTEPLAAKAQTAPSEVGNFVQDVPAVKSVLIGVWSPGLYVTTEISKGSNHQLFQTWTCDLPTKNYPKLYDEVDYAVNYDLCANGYQLTRNSSYLGQAFGGSWGDAVVGSATLTNAWKFYFRRGHYFKPSQVAATDAWWLYSGQDGDFPFYVTLTTPEFYLMMEPATTEAFTESSGGTPMDYSRAGGLAWRVPFGAFNGLAWKVRVWWRVTFDTHYDITAGVNVAKFQLRNELRFEGSSSYHDAVLGTDFDKLPLGESGPAFPP